MKIIKAVNNKKEQIIQAVNNGDYDFAEQLIKEVKGNKPNKLSKKERSGITDILHEYGKRRIDSGDISKLEERISTLGFKIGDEIWELVRSSRRNEGKNIHGLVKIFRFNPTELDYDYEIGEVRLSASFYNDGNPDRLEFVGYLT